MVAIFTGAGTGLDRGSANLLGGAGVVGNAGLGRGGEQLFLNAATGNLLISRRDEFLVGRGPDLAISRTYNSLGDLSDENGDNWRQSTDRRVYGLTGTLNTAGSKVRRVSADGTEIVYSWNGSAYVAGEGAGAADKLVSDGSVWTWTDGDSQVTERYEAYGTNNWRITRQTDPDGNFLTFAYTGDKLSQVATADGSSISYGWSGNNIVSVVTSYTQNNAAQTLTRTRYAYDGLNRLTTVTVDLSPENNSVADGSVYSTSYRYHGTSRQIASVSQTDGSKVEFAYDATGRVINFTQTVTSGVTRVTGIYYDLATRTTTITDPLGGQTTMRYDAAGNLTQITLPAPAPNTTAPTTSFGYNAEGDVISVTESGRTTTYEYDSNGNMTLSRDSSGNTARRTYGAKNELLTSTEYLVANPDLDNTPSDSRLTARYAYDSENHLRFTVSGDGRVTEFRYNPDGSLAATLRYTAHHYSTAGLQATSTIAESTLMAWAAGIDKTTIERTDATYDSRGNLSTVTTYSKTLADGSGDLNSTYTRTTNVYDQAGNLLSRHKTGIAGAETYFYDGLNRVVSSTDPAGAVATFTFNDAATTTTVAVGGTTRVSVFNRAGELISYAESGADIVTAQTVDAYDALGRLRMRTDPTGRKTFFLYDAAGRKVADISADGAMTEYGYDPSSRLVKTISYISRLSTSQIALLSGFSAGGSGGANAGGVSAASGPNLVANPSFEQSGAYAATATGRSNTDLPGWTKTNPETFEQVASGQMGVAASDGSFWLDLESIAKTGVMAVGANLIVNGSFETSGAFSATSTGRSNTDLPGWTKTNAETFEQVLSGQMGVTASNGSYWLDMESVATTGMMTVGSNLLVNGSFDQSGTHTVTATGLSNTDLPGWTKTNAETYEQVASGQMGVTGTDGTYWLDLESTAGSGPYPVGNNLLVNGSFEVNNGSLVTETGHVSGSIPGWIKANSQPFEQIGYAGMPVASTDGAYWLDMDSVTSGVVPITGNLIVNGSFEQSAATYTTTANGRINSGPIPGWTGGVFEQVNSGVGGVTATDGAFYIDGDASTSRMDISQTITGMTAGQTLIQFDYANIAGLVGIESESSGSLEVYWNGTLIAFVGQLVSTMVTKSYTVTAVAGNNTLRFRETGIRDGLGVSLDNVRVFRTQTNPGNAGNMDFSQTINLAAANTLQLQFDHANRTTAASGSFDVYWNGAVIASVNSTGTTMQTKTYMVAGVAGANTLRFVGTGTVDAIGASLDNVRLYATQTPPHGGNMDISQTVSNLTAGQVLQLKFDHANRTTSASGSFEVWWNNSLVATVADTGATMQTKTYQLTAVAGNNTLRFRSLGTVDAAGASLDNVRLLAMVPVPSGGNMDINQTIGGLAAGQVMQLQFDHANRTTAASGSFEVWWNNSLVATIAETGATMQTKTYLVTAAAGNNTLRFKSLGTVDDVGASIDNVRLFATQPVPSGGNMDISQTVSVASAGMMQLQFDHANRATAASGSFEVWWNGSLVATISETGTAMQTKTYYVNAVAGGNTLRFKSLGTVDDAGASIDNVRLFVLQGGAPAGASPTDPLAGLRPGASSLDEWTWRIYDNADRLIETIDSAGRATIFSYDGASRLVSTTSYATAFDSSTVAWFKSNSPAIAAMPASSGTDRTLRSFYDSDGRLVGTLDGGGGLSQVFHDAAGRKIREIAYANPVAAGLRATGTFAQLLASAGTSASDRRADDVYDQRGLLRFTIDALGHPTELVYDAAGQLIRTVDYGGQISVAASYSLAYVEGQISAAELAGHPATRVTRMVYDAAGRLAFQIDSEGAVCAYAYDQLGQMVKKTEHVAVFTAGGDQSLATMQGWAVSHANDFGNRVTRQIFDSAGRIAYAVDAESYVTEQRYDTAGRVTQSIRYPSSYPVGDGATPGGMASLIGPIPAQAVVTSYAYDSAGRLIDVTDGEGVITHFSYDGLSQVVDETVAYLTSDAVTLRRTYDSVGRVVSETQAYGTAEAATTSYTFDALGNLLTITDPRGSTTVRSHDALGNVLTVTVPIDGSTNAVLSKVYDRFGNVVKSTDARGNSSYVYYDRLGRVIAARDAENHVTETAYTTFSDVQAVTRRFNKATNSASIGVLPVVTADAARDATTSFEYDRLGRLAKTTDAEAYVTETAYTVFGEAKAVTRRANKKVNGSVAADPQNDATTGFEYDRLGRLTKTTDAQNFTEIFTLDAHGNRTQVTNKLSGVVTNVYDRRGLLLSETFPASAHAPAITNTFAYDLRENLKTKVEAYGLPEARTTTYVYDKTDRLVETRGTAVSVLDPATHKGTTSVVPTETVKYDLAGRVIETVNALGARTLFYYDAAGRMTAELAMDRFAGAEAKGTLTTRTYDASGNVLTSRTYEQQLTMPAQAGGATPVQSGAHRETAYSYDALNRVKTTSVSGVRTGQWIGTSYSTALTSIVTAFDYDAHHNVIKSIDANLAPTFSYYDRVGRKTAEVDREGYVTRWTHDSNGNVAVERRHAEQWLGTVAAGAPPAVATRADDRVTEFTYDRNGRRLTEKRLGVLAYSVDPATGALTAATQAAQVSYAYNGLGEVTLKTEANGDTVAYLYDNMGRLTKETRATYAGYAGAVTPTLRYFYNGLDDLSMTRQGGAAEAADDRITAYEYAAGGRLTRTTDAAGAARDYQYDAAGNLLAERYVRQKSDGSSASEAILYTRDLAGRITAQSVAVDGGSAWIKGDIVGTEFNAFGDVSRRGFNGLWQEQFAYDGAGRLWRTNSGDGVWRYFVHDAAGNQTLAIESEGANLAGLTLDSALAAATANGSVGGGFIDGVNTAVTVFDKRGLATQSRLPNRELGGGQALVTLITGRTYNAFGEATSETDARRYTTDFAYNATGRLIERKSPLVDVMSEAGTTSQTRPTEHFYYDVSGRLIGSDDANGNRTTQLLVAGTGHGGSQALAMKEFHADQGVAMTGYDVFGDARLAIDPINRSTTMAYDKMGRLIELGHSGGLTDYYAYDQLGQRIRHTNSFLGAAEIETTDYDAQGRIVSQVAFGGDSTTTSYAWDGTLDGGMGIVGGWCETTTYANFKYTIEKADIFGRELFKQDMGGYVFESAYDLAGRVSSRTAAAYSETQSHAWLNSGLAAGVSSTDGTVASYAYDAAGHRILEVTTRNGATIQNATASWDSLGRMIGWAEAGNPTAPAASVAHSYDANGNIRRTVSTYHGLAPDGTAAYQTTSETLFRFDAMNRLVQEGGVTYAYDAAGQRAHKTWDATLTAYVSNPWWGYDPNEPEYIEVSYQGQKREIYRYDAAGRVSQVELAETYWTTDSNGNVVSDGMLDSSGWTVGTHSYDAMGRLTRQIDYDPNSGQVAYDRQATYNNKSQVIFDTVSTRQGSYIFRNDTYYDYGYGTGYALGAAVTITADNYRNGNDADAKDTLTTNAYEWRDGAAVYFTSHDSDTGSSSNALFTNGYSYDAWGQLSWVNIADGRPRTVNFVKDSAGQVLRRDEADYNYSAGDPHEIWYRFGGREVGYTGNNGTLRTGYQASIDNRMRTPGTGAFRFGAVYGAEHADFNNGLDPINSYAQGSSAGGYTVRGGDTLASIAAQLWGDAQLWYKLAEANGLTADGMLAEGQNLIVPAGVMRSSHNASTFRPYDASEVVGDTSPTNPKMPKKNKCGMLGQVLMVVVAVAVTALTHGAAASAIGSVFGAAASGTVGAAATSIAAGAISGAVGSAASQAFGNVTGIQQGFSFKQVAMSAISGGVGGGLGSVIKGGGMLANAARGALGSAITQGIGVATGLQDKFDFAGVAAAAVGGAASGALGSRLPPGMDRHVGQALVRSADAIANAAMRSVIRGTSFGDNLLAALPDLIGSTIGNMVAERAQQALDGRRAADDIAVTGIPLEIDPEALPRLDLSLDLMVDPKMREALLNEAAARQVEARERLRVATEQAPAAEPDIIVTGQPIGRRSGNAAPPPVPVRAAEPPVDAPVGWIRPTELRRPLWMSTWRDMLRGYFQAMQERPGASNDPQVLENYEDAARRILWLDARIAGLDQELLDVILLGPRAGIGMASSGADFVINGIDYMAGNITFNQMVTNSVPGGELAGLSLRTSRAMDALGDAAAAERAARLNNRMPFATEGEVGDGIVYLRIDTTGRLAPYVGRTTEANELARQGAHVRAHPNSRFEFEQLGSGIPRGSQLDIAEHNAIQARTGGVAARRSSAVSNQRDPVGPRRRPTFGLPEPK
jgi:YD repeat-containing protein